MVTQSVTSAFWEFETELGWITIVGGGRKLQRLTFGAASRESSLQPLDLGLMEISGSRSNWFPDLVRRLVAFASGAVDDFRNVELELAGKTLFQQSVIKHCRSIPIGQTRSYAELARMAGRPGAARAVGSVMSSNRFPLVVPCHRVVRAGGDIGRFSGPGGAGLKQRLLDHESAMFAATE